MSALRVEVDGHTILIDPPRLLRIGRAIESDILLAGDSVSRVHAELRPTEDGWVLVDVASAHGTFVDGDRITEVTLTQETSVRCGPADTGSVFMVAPSSPRQTDAGFEHTRVVAAVRRGPAPGEAASRTGPDLLISAEGREHRFTHPDIVTVGRRPDCTVVLTDPVCSRLHGRFDAVPDGWLYTNSSGEGTFVAGRRVARLAVAERVALRLGHPLAGPEVVVVPILSAQEEERRLTRSRWARRLAVLGAAAVVLLVVAASGVTAAFLLDGSDPPSGIRSSPSTATPGLTRDELDSAKIATVLIGAESTDDEGNTVSWSGSGSIISPAGMILTNAHVAEPQADGLAQQYGPVEEANPDYLEIALTESADDSAAAPAYRARVVVSDGFLDVSVIQIYATIDGAPVEGELDLPTIPIGSSADLRTGEDVTVLGFPSISGSSGVSVTRGVISTFLDDDDLGPRSEIDTDARIAPGNSGGAAIDNAAEIIGIPSATISQQGSSVVSGRLRAIDVVKPLIAEAEAQTSDSQD